MEPDKRSKIIQSAVILLLAINQLIMQIKMNSYVRDMNSFKKSQIRITELEVECFRLLHDDFQHIHNGYHKILEGTE